VPSNKRAKELARAKHERQQARRATRQAKKRRVAFIGVGVGAALAVVLTVVLTQWDDSSENPSASGEPTAAATQSPPPPPVPTPSGVSCSEATATPQAKTFAKPGAEGLQPGATIAFNTSCGAITVALDVKAAPKTSNAIAFLAAQNWYNGNGCHRLTTEGLFVLQCGSPSLDGQGGPGFKIADENLPKDGPNDYPAGTVAMANSGPGTSGSQLFFVYKDTTLAASYSILGKIISGLDVVQYVAAHGVAAGSPSPSDGPPAQPIVIATTTLRKSG